MTGVQTCALPIFDSNSCNDIADSGAITKTFFLTSTNSVARQCTSSFNSVISTNVGSRFTIGLFLIFLALFAYRNAFKDSWKLTSEGETQQIINVFEFPPNESYEWEK